MIEDICCFIKDIHNRTEVMAELSKIIVGSLLTSLGASYTVKYFACVNPVDIAKY